MTVKEIIEKYLKDNGYVGLYCDECCCDIENLMCCTGFYDSGPRSDCMPGYKCECDPETCLADGDCEYHIGPKEGE
jgi:hypothetical protein